MPIRKYTKVVKKENGKEVIKYAFTNPRTHEVEERIFKNETRDVILFDTDNNKVLNDKEYEAYMEIEDFERNSSDDFDEDREIDAFYANYNKTGKFDLDKGTDKIEKDFDEEEIKFDLSPDDLDRFKNDAVNKEENQLGIDDYEAKKIINQEKEISFEDDENEIVFDNDDIEVNKKKKDFIEVENGELEFTSDDGKELEVTEEQLDNFFRVAASKEDFKEIHQIDLNNENKKKENFKKDHGDIFKEKSENETKTIHINYGLGLDKSKEFIKQKVTSSMFKNAVKYLYEEDSIGHISSESSIDMKFGDFVDKLYYQFESWRMSKDKDTNRYQNDKQKIEKDKELKNDLKEKAILRGIDESEAKDYVDDTIEKLDSILIHNQEIENNNLIVPRERHKKILIQSGNQLIGDTKDEVKTIEKKEKTVLAHLLGNGNPRNAFEQFLNQEKLKKGIYEYDEKTIQKFMKDSFLKENEKVDITLGIVRWQDIKARRSIYDYNKPPRVEDYDQKLFNKVALESQVEKNALIMASAKDYLRVKDIVEKKGFMYRIWHPFNYINETRVLDKWENTIKEQLVPGTEFSNNINKLLTADKKHRDAISEVCDKLIEEPLNGTNKNRIRYLGNTDEYIKVGKPEKEKSLKTINELSDEEYNEKLEDHINHNYEDKTLLKQAYELYRDSYKAHMDKEKPGFFNFSGRSQYNKEEKLLKQLEEKLLMSGVSESLIRNAKNFNEVSESIFNKLSTLPASVESKDLFGKLIELDEGEVIIDKGGKFERDFFDIVKPLYDKLNVRHLNNKQENPYEIEQYKKEAELLNKAKKKIMNIINYTEKDIDKLYGNPENELSAGDLIDKANKLYNNTYGNYLSNEEIEEYKSKDLSQLDKLFDKLKKIEPIKEYEIEFEDSSEVELDNKIDDLQNTNLKQKDEAELGKQ